MKQLAIVFAIFGFAFIPIKLIAEDSLAPVTITVINCTADLNISPKIEVSPRATPTRLYPRPVFVAIAQHENERGIYTASLNVAPGSYLLMARGAKCATSAAVNLTVFSSYPRHLLALTVSNYASVRTFLNNTIGILIPPGASVDLTKVPGSRPNPGVRDGSVMYFDDIASGSYVLEIWVHNVAVCTSLIIPDMKNYVYRRFIDLNVQDIAPYLRDASSRANPQRCDRISQNIIPPT